MTLLHLTSLYILMLYTYIYKIYIYTHVCSKYPQKQNNTTYKIKTKFICTFKVIYWIHNVLCFFLFWNTVKKFAYSQSLLLSIIFINDNFLFFFLFIILPPNNSEVFNIVKNYTEWSGLVQHWDWESASLAATCSMRICACWPQVMSL